VTSYLTFYDAAWPPAIPPETDGFIAYIGGDATHVWTLAEIRAQKARYVLPTYVRSNPGGIALAAADINAALAALTAIGAPRGSLVCFDLETAVDPLYVAAVYSGLRAAGYPLIVYGSQSTVLGNDVPDGLFFGADWSGVPHVARGDVMTQWVSFAAYDEDLADPGLPFWDTRPEPPRPPSAPPPIPQPAPVPAPAPEDEMPSGTISVPAGTRESFAWEAGKVARIVLYSDWEGVQPDPPVVALRVAHAASAVFDAGPLTLPPAGVAYQIENPGDCNGCSLERVDNGMATVAWTTA